MPIETGNVAIRSGEQLNRKAKFPASGRYPEPASTCHTGTSARGCSGKETCLGTGRRNGCQPNAETNGAACMRPAGREQSFTEWSKARPNDGNRNRIQTFPTLPVGIRLAQRAIRRAVEERCHWRCLARDRPVRDRGEGYIRRSGANTCHLAASKKGIAQRRHPAGMALPRGEARPTGRNRPSPSAGYPSTGYWLRTVWLPDSRCG